MCYLGCQSTTRASRTLHLRMKSDLPPQTIALTMSEYKKQPSLREWYSLSVLVVKRTHQLKNDDADNIFHDIILWTEWQPINAWGTLKGVGIGTSLIISPNQ